VADAGSGVDKVACGGYLIFRRPYGLSVRVGSSRVFCAESYDAMPIYEYHCKECGVFEVTQRITESPLTTCPTCGRDIRRLISLTSFVLKGSGWYATDYARSNGKSESSDDSSGKEPAANGSTDKSAASPSEPSKTSSTESPKPSSDKGASEKSVS
jgi:putative FmdB family regulatory protein